METELKKLIQSAGEIDPVAADKLFAMLYHELHGLAEHHLRRGGSGLTLGTTTLIHEAYLNIVGREDLAFPNQSRFLAYASRAMRGLVIDYARRRRAKKRGREFEITLAEDEGGRSGTESAEELGRLSDALDELAGLDPALAQLVDLHFFCGFSFAEVAALRGVSDRTVQRDWRKARMLLHHRLEDVGETSV
ncbi:MAG: ECF-type sigma factor [Gemmatimonadales bacterium]